MLPAQYDLSTSTFSPDGRVFQTDYAQKAVDNSGRGPPPRPLAVSARRPARLPRRLMEACRVRAGR